MVLTDDAMRAGGYLDGVDDGVDPVDVAGDEVDAQVSRLRDSRRHDLGAIRTVQIRLLDLRELTVVRPVQEPASQIIGS